MEILRSLEESRVVRSYQVLDFRTFADGRYYKLRIEFKDGSVLHAREYASVSERHYAYHWQDEEHVLRVRWDNAPHHGHLVTHPHHRHEGAEVLPSEEITLPDVVGFIEEKLLD